VPEVVHGAWLGQIFCRDVEVKKSAYIFLIRFVAGRLDAKKLKFASTVTIAFILSRRHLSPRYFSKLINQIQTAPNDQMMINQFQSIQTLPNTLNQSGF
jgi:hypothetical protein